MKIAQATWHQSRWTFGWVLLAVAWWIWVAWSARRPASVIGLTNEEFVLGLVFTYIAAWSVIGSRAHDARGTTLRAIAFNLALVFGLLILEAPAAAGLLDYRRIREAITGAQGPDVAFVDDRDLVWRRMPNAHWSGRPRTDMADYFNLSFRAAQPITFSTDANGFRNLTTPERADIALIGDSYVEGITVSDHDTAAAKLHDMTGLAVADFGVAGYGTLQELTVLKKYAVPLHPKLVAWFFFEGNDLDDDQTFENSRMVVPKPAGTNAARVIHSPAALRWRSFVDRSFTRNAFLEMREVTDSFVPNGLDTFGWFQKRDGSREKIYFFDFYATRKFTDFEARRLEVTRATLREAAQIAREQGIRLVLFYVPIKFRVYGDLCMYPQGSVCPTWRPWDLESRVSAVARDAGIEFVSLTDRMHTAAREGQLLYMADDSHWNAAGHAFVANQVARIWVAHDDR